MVSSKGKRKIIYQEKLFFWFVRANQEGIFKIHILSEDKQMNLEYPLFDSEVPVTPAYIRRLLEKYYGERSE